MPNTGAKSGGRRTKRCWRPRKRRIRWAELQGSAPGFIPRNPNRGSRRCTGSAPALGGSGGTSVNIQGPRRLGRGPCGGADTGFHTSPGGIGTAAANPLVRDGCARGAEGGTRPWGAKGGGDHEPSRRASANQPDLATGWPRSGAKYEPASPFGRGRLAPRARRSGGRKSRRPWDVRGEAARPQSTLGPRSSYIHSSIGGRRIKKAPAANAAGAKD